MYYSDGEVTKTDGFPQHFSRCLLFWDWERPFIKWARLDENSNLVELLPFTNAVVGATDHGHHVNLGTLNLAGSKSVTFHASSGNVGGKIELRSGSPTGDLLATVEVPNTGGWDKYIDPTATLAATPRAAIFAVFVNPGKGGLMNLDWVEFKP